MMILRCYIALLGAVLSVTGCGSSSSADSSTTTEETSSTAVLSAFNLSDISASGVDVKAMTLTRGSASDDSGVTYSVCEEIDGVCNELTSVTNTLSATVTVDSLLSELSTNYYIVAGNSDDETQSSNEETLTTDTVTQMIGYIKASNAGEGDYFGFSVASSGDGNTLIVGAISKSNSVTGIITDGSEIDGDLDGTSTENTGAVYMY